MKIVLKNPVTFEGEELKEIDLDLDRLTGEDLVQAEKEYFLSGGHPVAPLSVSSAYCTIIGARSAKLPMEAIRALPLKECSRIVSEIQAFLLSSES